MLTHKFDGAVLLQRDEMRNLYRIVFIFVYEGQTFGEEEELIPLPYVSRCGSVQGKRDIPNDWHFEIRTHLNKEPILITATSKEEIDKLRNDFLHAWDEYLENV